MKRIIIIAALALSGTAHAGEAFSNGFEHGYDAVNPRHIGPSHLGPLLPFMYPKDLGQSDFDAGIAAGMRAAQEDREPADQD